MPFFVFSSMSAHTKDLQNDGRCSLTVLAGDFKGAAQGRVVLIGSVTKLEDESKKASLREKYLAKHKDAYWIDFGYVKVNLTYKQYLNYVDKNIYFLYLHFLSYYSDFTYYTMTSLETVRFVGGFAMAGSVTPSQYQAAKPDPVAAFAAPVMKHMNEDHTDSLVAIVKHYIQVPCYGAEMVGMDKLGMTVSI